MAERSSALATILFTDLEASTELLCRAGDEDAQRIFRAHHRLLADTAAAHGGNEVKWLGDGLMASFHSAADALRCAISMQQASARPVEGERLDIRVGLNAGEAFHEETDLFGLPVVIARRLCDRAGAGRILCSDLVRGLLAGRASFSFTPLGALDLKGVPQPVEALEVTFDRDSVPGSLTRLPFVGRSAEFERLIGRVRETAGGHGGLVLVAGEAGIGKTRLLEELAHAAGADGFSVLWGRCLEGDWSPPYAAFSEILQTVAADVPPEELHTDLGAGASALAQLADGLRRTLPDLPAAVALKPDEERFRLLEAMAQFLAARARRAPVLLCLDDLQWADASTVAMLRHLARATPRQRVLITANYRDSEVQAGHPLHDALGSLRREVEFERVRLGGLEAKAVLTLLEALTDQDVLGSVAHVIASETDGNPFFIKEVLRHLLDEGRFVRGPDGRWTSDRPVAEWGIPEGVREVIDRRLARLSAGTNKLLSAASIFESDIRLGVAATVADLEEDAALDALDEALDAHLLQPAGGIDLYRFTQALIRHTLAGELSPSRRARLHLRAAQALTTLSGPRPSPMAAGEIASQYHRCGLPGAEQGIEPALIAADHAEATGGQAEAAGFLRIALDLMGEDPRRPRLLGRLGIALIWSLAFDDGLHTALAAGDAIAATEGPAAAAEYLAGAAVAMGFTANNARAADLAQAGLRYSGDVRDLSWAYLFTLAAHYRDASDPEHPGIPDDRPERWTAARIIRAAKPDVAAFGGMETPLASRAEAVAESENFAVLVCFAGEFARSLPLTLHEAQTSLARGQIVRAARCFMQASFCATSLGDLDGGRRALEEAERLAATTGSRIFGIMHARELLTAYLDDETGLDAIDAEFEALLPTLVPAQAWAVGPTLALRARTAARLHRAEAARRLLGELVPWLERAPAWTYHFANLVNYAAETLWLLGAVEHAEVVERALRDKVLAPDFRDIGGDARHSLGRLCALQGHHDEARAWFAEARGVLDAQGARPLRAIVDLDEAQLLGRRGGADDASEAGLLLESARRQFQTLGMTGWLKRAL